MPFSSVTERMLRSAGRGLPGAGGAKLDVVDATVHAVDHEMHMIAHLVTAKAL